MMDWNPIDILPDHVVAILYQPKGELQDEGMVIASVERWRGGYFVTPEMVGGYEFECDVKNPTHWMPRPEPPK